MIELKDPLPTCPECGSGNVTIVTSFVKLSATVVCQNCDHFGATAYAGSVYEHRQNSRDSWGDIKDQAIRNFRNDMDT